MTNQSRILKAAVIRAIRDGNPISVTVEDLEYAKQYEEKHGKIEVTSILQDRAFTLGIAEAWPTDERINSVALNGDHHDI